MPSLEDEKPNNFLLEMLSVEVLSIQLVPESVEVQIFPILATAASFVPSLEEVMPRHGFRLPVEVI